MTVPVIQPQDFDLWVLREKKPVLLLACQKVNPSYRLQLQAMETLDRRLGGKVKVGLLDEEYLEAYKQGYGIGGTPTYLLFYDGELKGRMFGCAESRDLEEFVLNTLH